MISDLQLDARNSIDLLEFLEAKGEVTKDEKNTALGMLNSKDDENVYLGILIVNEIQKKFEKISVTPIKKMLESSDQESVILARTLIEVKLKQVNT